MTELVTLSEECSQKASEFIKIITDIFTGYIQRKEYTSAQIGIATLQVTLANLILDGASEELVIELVRTNYKAIEEGIKSAKEAHE